MPSSGRCASTASQIFVTETPRRQDRWPREWSRLVRSGNDGHAVRTRPWSLAGAIAFRRAYAGI
jgi:hypothetical protein